LKAGNLIKKINKIKSAVAQWLKAFFVQRTSLYNSHYFSLSYTCTGKGKTHLQCPILLTKLYGHPRALSGQGELHVPQLRPAGEGGPSDTAPEGTAPEWPRPACLPGQHC